MLKGRRFRFHPGWALLAAAGCAATIGLGTWQTGRAHEKEDLAARIERLAREPAVHVGSAVLDAAAVEHRRLEARGRFEPEGTVLADNRVRDGRVGYEVYTPLRVNGSAVRLLVNRGWVAGTGRRDVLPQIRTPSGEVGISGRAVNPGERVYELSGDVVAGRVWQNVSARRYAERMNLPVQPVVLQQESDLPDGLLRAWPAVDTRVGVHKSYAFQWYALAILILVVYILLSFRRDA